MCTVSFYKNKDTFIITSNRDEHIDRPVALQPQKYKFDNQNLIFPKDPKAEGTWFCVNTNGNVFVLLNGAETKHISNRNYRKSRGIILLEISKSLDLLNFWQTLNLDNIEPFSIISYFNQELFLIRWNGSQKTTQKLVTEKSYIWSSSTLYSEIIFKERVNWFESFLKQKNNHVTADDLIYFHKNTAINDSENGLIIKRNNGILTKNISQVIVNQQEIIFKHFDLINHQNTIINTNFE